MFKERYRKSVDQIHAREGLLYSILEKEKAPRKKRGWIVAASAACATAFCGLFAVALIGHGTQTKDAAAPEPVRWEASLETETVFEVSEEGSRIAGIRPAASYKEVYRLLEQSTEDRLRFPVPAAVDASGGVFVSGEVFIEKAEIVEEGVIGTNEQVEGVGEADLVKTDGSNLFVLDPEQRKLHIVAADDGKLTLTDSYLLPQDDEEKGIFWRLHELFVAEDTVFVLMTRYTVDENFRSKSETVTLVLDCSDLSAVKERTRHEQSGGYLSSRMTDGYVYVVTRYSVGGLTWEPDRKETFLPLVDGAAVSFEDILITEECTAANYTVVTGLSVTQPETVADEKALLGRNDTVYCSPTQLVLTATEHTYTRDEEERTDEQGRRYVQSRYETDTAVTLLSLDRGQIREEAFTKLDGRLHNSFSIDLCDGFLRMVLMKDDWTETIYTDGIDTYESQVDISTSLVVLDGALNVVGAVTDLAPGETVRSVRFLGDAAYFVTFLQTDPLFAVDLCDPYAPRVLSELKITGFSAYLHPFGEGRLLGIGYEAEADTGGITGVKLSLYDISDPARVQETARTILNGYWTDAESNHKSVFVDVGRGLIGFPVEDRYCFFRYEEGEGFTLLREIQGDWTAFRAVAIGDVFYSISADAIESIDLLTYRTIDRLTLSE